MTRTAFRHVTHPNPYPPSFVAAMILGVGLNPVNSTLISTALAPIAHGIGVSAAQASLLVSVLYLTCTIAQPTAGRLSERVGARRVFLAGAMIVIVGGVVGGVAQNLNQLIVSRVLIGMGTSAGYPSAMLMVRRGADDAGLIEPPSTMLAALAVVGLVLIAVGPPLGGALVAALGWRATFFVKVPVGVATMVLGITSIPPDEKRATGLGLGDFVRAMDVIGIVAFGLFVSALLVFLMTLPTLNVLMLVSTILLLCLLVLWELHVRAPFVDVRELATNTPLTLNFVRSALTMLGAYVVLYALPEWLEDACGQSPDVAGLVIVPMGVVATVASTIASRSQRIKMPLLLCSAAMIGSGLLLGVVDSSSALAVPLLASAISGLVLGLSMAVGQLALYGQASAERMGSASGLLRTFIYLGSIGASALSGAFFSTVVSDAGMRGIGMVVAVLGGVALLLTLVDRSIADATSSHGAGRIARPTCAQKPSPRDV